ncbi:Alpha N-terminal protein methyltransferase 1 [Trapelia coarctata]|nr:Alpha N-terminal protein methyltransferase 1 [Trapelia coarctata]
MVVQPPDSHISHSETLAYWNNTPATVNGMLGGYPHVSRIDLRGSATFLAKLRKGISNVAPNSPLKRGVDCGAGIGRVTAGFLSKVCAVIDIVEPVGKFGQEARVAEMSGEGAVGEVHVTGLEGWVPVERYDLIWNQWCLGHLTDTQLVEYFKRCKCVVENGGWIVVKENMSTNPLGEDLFDELDSSVTRTDMKFRRLFEESGLEVVRSELQTGFPKELYPVRFYALQPRALNGELT